MIIHRLDVLEVREVYKKFLSVDFSANERRPLVVIERAMEKGLYVCYAALEEGAICAYAFFVVLPGKNGSGTRYLFDYYAVAEELRGKGIGGCFIGRLLHETLVDASSVLVEIDNPAYAWDEAEREIRERRRSFYIKNGLIDTGVDVCTFGVEFRLMEAVGEAADREEVCRNYADLYRVFLPPKVFERVIVIRG